MDGVKFGDYHSYNNLDLILSSKTIGEAAVKKNTVEIPGIDGELDMTEYFGEPLYDNRTLSFDFSSIEALSDQPTQYTNIQNKLNGQKMNIYLDTDPNYYYVGRISVGNWTNDKRIGKVTITADCEPWKYKKTETTVSRSISSSGTVTLSNTLRKTVVPVFSTTAAITVAWSGGSQNLSAGNNQTIAGLTLKSGTTTLTITGSATVTIKYREAVL